MKKLLIFLTLALHWLIPYYGTPLPKFVYNYHLPKLSLKTLPNLFYEESAGIFYNSSNKSYFIRFEDYEKKIILSKEQDQIALEISKINKWMTPALKIAFYESSFNPNAKGQNKEEGLFQFKPATWNYLSKKSGITGSPFDVETSTKMFMWAWEHGYRKWWTTSKLLTHPQGK